MNARMCDTREAVTLSCSPLDKKRDEQTKKAKTKRGRIEWKKGDDGIKMKQKLKSQQRASSDFVTQAGVETDRPNELMVTRTSLSSDL